MSGEQSIGQNESPQTQPFPRREDICFPEKPLRVGAGGGGGCCAALMAQTVKNLPTMWVTQVLSLGQEDPLKEGMATQSSILAWRIP